MQFQPITRNNDFLRAYRKGKNSVHPFVVVYVNKNRVGHMRVGITASKKIGNAVTRNRARRVIRHALAAVVQEDLGGYDLVLVARGQTAQQKSTRLEYVLRKLLKKCGLSPGTDASPKQKVRGTEPTIQPHSGKEA